MPRKKKLNLAAMGLQQVRRVIIFVIGTTVLLIGIALLVLPGPAIVVIPAGLAILGQEFRWARKWMRRARTLMTGTSAEIRKGRRPWEIWRTWRRRLAQRRRRRHRQAQAQNGGTAPNGTGGPPAHRA